MLQVTLGVSLVVAGGAIALSASAPALAARAAPGASSRATLTLSLSPVYHVKLPTGSWLPVTIAVTNSGTQTIVGEIELRSVSRVIGLSPRGCLPNGPTTLTCTAPLGFQGPARPSSVPAGVGATYDLPVTLAAGSSKTFSQYVVAGPGSAVSAVLISAVGEVLARARARLGVARGAGEPAVLVVSDHPASMANLAQPATPSGSPVQVQYLLPSGLPVVAPALGAFRAVEVDQADTSLLGGLQAQALLGYVEAGGTIVVAGGLGWLGTTAGLPSSLLAGWTSGQIYAMALPSLPRLLGAPAIGEKVDVVRLRPRAGSEVVFSQGSTPLVLEAARGAGRVVTCAFDPAALPLSIWRGSGALLRRILAPAFDLGSYGGLLPYGEAGGIYPAAIAGLPVPPAALSAPQSSPTLPLVDPAVVATELVRHLRSTGTLRQLPSAAVAGLLLVAYVVAVGPACFLALAYFKRRTLAWVVVPGLAICVALATRIEWPGAKQPVFDEARIVQLAPSSHLALVTSLGLAKLSGREALRVDLASASPPYPVVGSLGGELRTVLASLAVVPGSRNRSVTLEFAGKPGSVGGWAASEVAHVAGQVRAVAWTDGYTASGGELKGSVTNGLGISLKYAQVVAAGDASQLLGTLAPGASSPFVLMARPYGSPPLPAFGVHSALERLLGNLAQAYSDQQNGAPVIVALAAGDFLKEDVTSQIRSAGDTEVVVVPVSMVFPTGTAIAGVPGQLVGTKGLRGGASYALSTSSLVLGKGGYFDYQFPLPHRQWHQLVVDLGSSDGAVDGLGVRVSVYDYTRQRWDTQPAKVMSGTVEVDVVHPRPYLVGGALQLRVRAIVDGVDVYGDFPTVSAFE